MTRWTPFAWSFGSPISYQVAVAEPTEQGQPSSAGGAGGASSGGPPSGQHSEAAPVLEPGADGDVFPRKAASCGASCADGTSYPVLMQTRAPRHLRTCRSKAAVQVELKGCTSTSATRLGSRRCVLGCDAVKQTRGSHDE